MVSSSAFAADSFRASSDVRASVGDSCGYTDHIAFPLADRWTVDRSWISLSYRRHSLHTKQPNAEPRLLQYRENASNGKLFSKYTCLYKSFDSFFFLLDMC